MKKFKVYIVMYKPRNSEKWYTSQEGYSTEEKAINYIETRCNVDTQIKRTAHWVWEADNGEKYAIKEIDIV